jgi:ABC-type uncharacterized transport system substrate-binding protein
MRSGPRAMAGLAALLALTAPALAHPHVFVDASLELDVAESGDLRAIRHEWTFDDMYSAFAVQGLPREKGAPTRAALAKLAEEIVEKLDDVDHFTRTMGDGHELQSNGVRDARATFDDGRLRLSFTLMLRAIGGAGDYVRVQVFDPQYVVAITLKDAVQLSGPARCTRALTHPGPLHPADARQLDDSTRTNQLAQDFGAKLATTLTLDCRENK